jgi:hypothetical protein
MVVSIVNQEVPGIFLSEFDKGRRGRFGYIFDPQGRVPSTTFGINGGEKGTIFARQPGGEADVWMAFYALEDYKQGTASYSDAFDLVEPLHDDLSIDVRNPARSLHVEARLDLAIRSGGVRAIPFRLNESLPQTDSLRLKRAMRLKSARFADGSGIIGGGQHICLWASRHRMRHMITLQSVALGWVHPSEACIVANRGSTHQNWVAGRSTTARAGR